MKQKIDKIKYLGTSFKINMDFLNAIETIVKTEAENVEIEYTIVCNDDVKTEFNSLEEIKNNINLIQSRIVKLEIKIHIPIDENTYRNNEVRIVFNNSYETLGSNANYIQYEIYDAKLYYTLSSKIEQTINNFKLLYSLLARLPLTMIVILLCVVFLYVFIELKSIVLPTNMSLIIMLVVVIAFLIDAISPQFYAKFKRNLFPFVEFRLGANDEVEEKWNKVRNFFLSIMLIPLICSIIKIFIELRMR